MVNSWSIRVKNKLLRRINHQLVRLVHVHHVGRLDEHAVQCHGERAIVPCVAVSRMAKIKSNFFLIVVFILNCYCNNAFFSFCHEKQNARKGTSAPRSGTQTCLVNSGDLRAVFVDSKPLTGCRGG